jgi:hypothetical protein
MNPRNMGGDELPLSLSTKPVVGYRLWRVYPDERGMALRSLNVNHTWAVDNTAQCFIPQVWPWPNMGIPTHDDPAPSLSCQCGFYCALPEHPLQEWAHVVAGLVHASGTVALTGRVIRCTLGFKAEHATIQSPVVLDVDCGWTPTCEADVTRVEVLAGGIRGWCDEHTPRQGAVIEAVSFFREAVRQLSARYQPCEFISWMTF